MTGIRYKSKELYKMSFQGMGTHINLRMLEFIREGRVDIICLDTDIAVSASSESEARQKMNNATALYMNNFSLDQLESGKYLRLAPIKYRILNTVVHAIKLWHRFKTATANYDSR